MKNGILRGPITAITTGALIQSAAAAGLPAIQSLNQNGQFIWSNAIPGTFTMIQRATTLDAPVWEPFWYDTADVGLHTNWPPDARSSPAFYRLAVETNVPDPSLVLYLPFDNDFTNSGEILDASGYGNNALRYSLTNWPTPAVGPDDSMAAEFVRATTNTPFEGGGDYAGIPWTTNAPFYSLTNGTLLAWAHYNANSYHASVIIDGSSYSIFPYSWFLGRDYSSMTRFEVYNASGGVFHAVTYPDSSAGDTGGWHYYGVTWDGTNFIGYYDGLPISTNSQAGFPALVLGGKANAHWIAIGCLTHNGTPQIDGDGYPNNGFFGGEIDDIRLYNRPLSGAEIQALYNRMHKF